MNKTVELNTRMVKYNGINRNQVSVLEKKELVTHSCPTLCNPMDCSPPRSSVHGILQARILELPFPPPGIFLTQGSNLCLFHLRHWQAGSLPLAPPGSRGVKGKSSQCGEGPHIGL